MAKMAGVVWPHPIKAVIFDCDGTILDTVKCYIEVDSHMVGEKLEPSILAKLNGKCEREEAECLIEMYKLNMTPEEFIRARDPMLKQALSNAGTVPGVERIIKKIHEMGIPMAVATSSFREMFETKTTNHKELFSLFKCSVCGNEVTQVKPSPEIFLTAAKKLGTFKPENVLVFEDATNGVKAANRVQYSAVLLTRTEKDLLPESLKKADAHPTLTIDSFDDFDFDKFLWK